MVKNKKISLIILFILIFVFLLNTFTFATDETITDYYTDKDVQDLFKNSQEYMVLNNYSYKDYIVCQSSNFVSFIFLMPENNILYVGDYNGSERVIVNYYYLFEYVNGVGFTETTVPIIKNTSQDFALYKAETITHSSVDIYKEDNTLFFQRTPFPLGVLAPIMEKVETKATAKEIIMILPLILVVVVCFLGLRKALQMLSTLLHRCLII